MHWTNNTVSQEQSDVTGSFVSSHDPSILFKWPVVGPFVRYLLGNILLTMQPLSLVRSLAHLHTTEEE